MHFICASEMKERLNLKLGDAKRDDFFNPICVFGGLNPGFRGGRSAGEALSQPVSEDEGKRVPARV